jgi:hypothetical protein
MSSFKLQFCLELCLFIHAHLKPRLQGRKRIFLIKFSKETPCSIHQNRWRITRGTQLEKRVLHLESHCYNKSHPSPKLTTSLSFDECKHLLVCCKSLPDLPKCCLNIVHFQPSALFGSRLSSSHIMVVS